MTQTHTKKGIDVVRHMVPRKTIEDHEPKFREAQEVIFVSGRNRVVVGPAMRVFNDFFLESVAAEEEV